MNWSGMFLMARIETFEETRISHQLLHNVSHILQAEGQNLRLHSC
jgi:hypothetical protein